MCASHVKTMRKPAAKRILVDFLKLASKRQFMLNKINTYVGRGKFPSLKHSKANEN